MIVGIDLGTTNSSVSVWKDGEVQIIPNAMGKGLTPSVVGLDDDGEIVTGAAARERLVRFPDTTAAAFKRYMGSNREVRLGDKPFRPEELSSLILASLKEDAEVFTGEKISEAVITVPAYFNDTQRKATRIAGEMAGLKVERLLNEPTSAALAYGLHQTDEEKLFIVFDLGGGTFDVSILELFDGVMEVRASAGDNFLGGEDFSGLLMKAFLEHLEKEHGVAAARLNSAEMGRIKNEVEITKNILSAEPKATLKTAARGKTVEWEITRERFESLSQPLLDRISKPIERVLRDSDVKREELDAVVQVGGATRMPMISRLITRLFRRFPNKEVDPDLVVANGAAIQAALKSRDRALEDVVMTDICPYTLGVEVLQFLDRNYYKEGVFLPIIERNNVVPLSRTEYVTTVHEAQKQVKVIIYQGESLHIKDNIFLGKLSIPVQPPPGGEESIEIRFTYDINGILEVEALVVRSGDIHRLIIEENPGALSREEIEERLKKLRNLKIHPRDQSRNKAVLSRAERLYEENLGDKRRFLGEQILIFQTILDRQKADEIEKACGKLTEILDSLDRYQLD